MGYQPNTTDLPLRKIIERLSDLPTPVAGVITLPANTTYYFVGEIDLLGNRLVCGANVNLFGDSSETTILKSTGLNDALITSQFTLVLRYLTITANIALDINGGVNYLDVALDWIGVNFTDCFTVGTIQNFNNFVYQTGAFLNSNNLVLTGTFNTVALESSLFVGSGVGNIVSIPPAAIIQRRFRVIYSAFVANGTNTAINFNLAATVPFEGYILDTVNFSGAGTYIAGVQNTDNKAKFSNCVGIVNSTSIVNMFMKNNATATVIASAGVRYPMLGTTEVGSIIQRFSHDLPNNAVTYTSTVSRTFKIQATFTALMTTNNVCGFYIGINRSGNPIDAAVDRVSESEVYITGSGTRPDGGAVQCLAQLNQNDRVYMIVQNTTAANNITVQFLNLVIIPTT